MGAVWSRAAESQCVFCDIAEQPEVQPRESIDRRAVVAVTPVFYRDERVVAFYPRGGVSTQHVLVVPRVHKGSVRDLAGAADVELLDHMRAVGERLLTDGRSRDSGGTGEFSFVFHVPPFISVPHLHLHCFELPLRSNAAWAMYTARQTPFGLLQWCASWAQVREGLGADTPQARAPTGANADVASSAL